MSSLESAESAFPAKIERPPVSAKGVGRLSGEFVRSLIVAAVALAVDYGLMMALHDLAGVYHLLAATAGFCAGLATNYALSVAWVFRSRSVANRWLEFAIFAAVGFAGLGLTLGIMYLGTDMLGGEYRLVRLVAVCLVFVWNFGVRKLALFRAGTAQ